MLTVLHWIGSLLTVCGCFCGVPVCRFKRLYPDSSLQVETERLEAIQASLLGVFASHALLMAFALKLKMSAALRQPDRSSRQPGETRDWPGQQAATAAGLHPGNTERWLSAIGVLVLQTAYLGMLVACHPPAHGAA